jgi:hypothetical protein
VADIAPLCRQQPGIQMLGFGEISQKFSESFLCQVEKSFVVPKRIIRIEANCA